MATPPTLLAQIQANTAPGPLYEPDAQGSPAPTDPKVRLIAFYLPQFHAIPENDQWWGRGFTEWTNVTKALPRFAGHYQPRLPADLGFYDLRNPQVLRDQARLARRYGIAGFCFHHYWFNGRRLLETPLQHLLDDPSIDLPFCIDWANENWTRRWDGADQDVLLAQSHSPEDDVAFAQSLIPIVQDPRYIRIDGRPLVMIYRPGLLPDAVATMGRWRTEFARAGLADPYIVMAQAFHDRDPRLQGVDAAAEFPPHKVGGVPGINAGLTVFDPDFDGHVIDYADVARHAAGLPRQPYTLFRGVVPSWDNEARKPGRGYTFTGATPAAYGTWLGAACRTAIAEAAHPDERIVFINAWNEWAEGAYLEPDRHFGHAFLAETARVLHGLDRTHPAHDGRIRLALISHDAHVHGAQHIALTLARTLVADPRVDLIILLGGPGDLTPHFAAIAPTHTVPGDFADPVAWQAATAHLVASGVTAVIANTAVAAGAMVPLHAAGLRVVQLIHELPSLIRQYGLEPAIRDAAALAAVIVFPSETVRDRFVELAGPIQGATVIRHQGLMITPVPPAERPARRAQVREALGIAPGRPVVLGMGYGDVRKGLDLWPTLIRRTVSLCADAVFVWAGRTDPALVHWLQHDLRIAGLTGHLVLPGHTDDPAGLFAAADAFVLTSREDPFPSVVIEAMASSLPTLVFEGGGGIVDLVRQAGGVAIPYLDTDAMGTALATLLNDAPAAAAMGHGLSTRIARDFDPAGYAAALIALAAPEAPAAPESVAAPEYDPPPEHGVATPHPPT